MSSDLESWLDHRWMARFSNVLIENNFKDLASIVSASPEQRQKIISIFEKPGHRLKIRLLLEELDSSAAGATGTTGATAAVADSPTVSSVAASPPVAAQSSSPPLPRLSLATSASSTSLPEPIAPYVAPPPPPGLLSPRGGEEFEILSSSEDEDEEEEENDDKEALPPPRVIQEADVVAAAAALPSTTTSNTDSTSSDAPLSPTSKPTPLALRQQQQPASTRQFAAVSFNSIDSVPLPLPPPSGSSPEPNPVTVAAALTTVSKPPPPMPKRPSSQALSLLSPSSSTSSLPNAAVAAPPPIPSLPAIPAVPDAPAELPPFPDSDDSSSDDEPEPSPTAAAEAPPVPPVPSVPASPSSSTNLIKKGSSTDLTLKTSDAFRRRQEAFQAQAQAQLSPKPAAPGPVSVKPSDAFRNKAAGIGAALGAAMARGPPVFKKQPQQNEEEAAAPPPQPLIRPAGVGVASPVAAGFAPPPKSPVPPHSKTVQDSAEQGHIDDDEESEYKLPPTSSLINPDKTGTLQKRGVDLWNQNYKSRYFILKGQDLFWLKNKQSKQPSGMIRITEKGLQLTLLDDHTLQITTRKKSYVVCASSAHEMNEWYIALQKAQGSNVDDASGGPAPAVNPFKQIEASADQETQRLMKTLVDGSFMFKYKRKKGQERMIYCPMSLDRILWADDLAKKKVKGYLMISDISRITDGCFGSKRNENAFTLVAAERTLELEACSLSEKQDWVKGIGYLMKNIKAKK